MTTKADVVIRGGTVVDGTGAAPIEADVAIAGDRIVQVGHWEGPAADVIDARGKIVTPGFIDIHTHLDAQLTWDPMGAPACYHGITTVVVGNCGVGFAPCKPKDREYLMYLMEGVEDIPQQAMALGMRWQWESFGEYLAALERNPLGLNVGAYVAHAPLRVWAMGERGASEAPPNDDEAEAIRRAVDEAIAAGALGVSTGRTTMHRTPAGDPVPGTFAGRRELWSLVEPMARRQAGLFQVVPYGAAGEAADGFDRDFADLAWIAHESRRPVSVGVTQARQYPEVWRSSLAQMAGVNGGTRFVPQVAPRSIGLMLGFGGLLSPLLVFPEAGDLLGRPDGEVLAALRDPTTRARIAASLDPAGEIMAGLASLDRVFLVEDIGVEGYETSRERSVVGVAERRGVSPGQVMLDALVATELRQLFLVAIYNWDLDAAETMIRHPLTIPSLGDAGAHTSQTCDVGVPTFLLAYWVRRRRAMALETAVQKLTVMPAAAWGMTDRGTLRPGAFADVNVLDFDRLDLCAPEVRHDLPGGATNLSQKARGYEATLVNGRVVMRAGAPTGALAGRVVRNAAAG